MFKQPIHVLQTLVPLPVHYNLRGTKHQKQPVMGKS